MIKNAKAQACIVYTTADRELCFDLWDLISAVGVTDTYSRPCASERFFACGLYLQYTSYKNQQKSSRPNSFAPEKAGDEVGAMSAYAAEKALNVSAIRAQICYADAKALVYDKLSNFGEQGRF